MSCWHSPCRPPSAGDSSLACPQHPWLPRACPRLPKTPSLQVLMPLQRLSRQQLRQRTLAYQRHPRAKWLSRKR